MATIETAVVTRLLAVSGVNSLTTNIFRGYLPEGKTYPAVIVERDSTDRQISMDGDCELVKGMLSVTSYAATHTAAQGLAAAVRAALHIQEGTWDTIVIQFCRMDDEGDTMDMSVGADKERVWGIQQRYEIWYEES